MAVYTDVNEDQLRAFLADYDAGTLLSCKGIAEGVENSNFLLKTTEDTYILTLYEKRVRPEDLPFFLGLMQHFSTRGLSCPLPIQRRDGDNLGELAGRPAAMISFLDGAWLRKPKARHCREVGRALAAMHVAADDFPIRRANALAMAGWRPLWEASRAGADDVQAGLAGEIDQVLANLESRWPDGLAEGVIHADLFPDNVFFIEDALSGVIDFYFACNDFLAYDIAICLNAWCFEADGAFNLTKGMSLIDGYQSLRPLDCKEIDALPLLAEGAALRFFLTRLYDWLTTPEGALVVKKDPLEYLRKLRFHGQVASSAEYGLRSREQES